MLLSGCSADDHYVHEETQSSLKKKHVSLFTFCSKDVLCPCKLSFAKALNGNNRKKGSKIKSQILCFLGSKTRKASHMFSNGGQLVNDCNVTSQCWTE